MRVLCDTAVSVVVEDDSGGDDAQELSVCVMMMMVGVALPRRPYTPFAAADVTLRVSACAHKESLPRLGRASLTRWRQLRSNK